mmetsp:Transcript_53766/g.151107  ORF Transcript_53766/g.151107 Transcript_53766/m.151107 type:complete len:209 (+) Transcript_53766:130-756(+)
MVWQEAWPRDRKEREREGKREREREIERKPKHDRDRKKATHNMHNACELGSVARIASQSSLGASSGLLCSPAAPSGCSVATGAASAWAAGCSTASGFTSFTALIPRCTSLQISKFDGSMSIACRSKLSSVNMKEIALRRSPFSQNSVQIFFIALARYTLTMASSSGWYCESSPPKMKRKMRSCSCVSNVTAPMQQFKKAKAESHACHP